MSATGNQNFGAFGRPVISARNDCGEEIPPFGCVQLYAGNAEFVGQTGGGRSQTYFYVQKYSSTSDAPVVFNGAANVPVASGTIGYGSFQLALTVPVLALLKSDIVLDYAWSLGLSPVDGQFYLDVGSRFDCGGVFPDFGDYSQVGFIIQKSSAPSYRCIFEITSVNDANPSDVRATGTVKYRMPASCVRLPVEDDYQQITVHDPNQCVFTGYTAELINKRAWADYMSDADDPSVLLWITSGLCCEGT